MSRRSKQAFDLGRRLSATTGANVELRHEQGSVWFVEWGNGPTVDQMREHLATALAGEAFDELGDRRLRYFRGESARAWAARAIAARRDGSLAREVATGAAYRRTIPSRPLGRTEQLTPEDHAALAYVERLVAETPNPDQASAPEDLPLIEELLAAGEHNEYRMVRILTDVDRAPSLSPDGPLLRLIEGDGEP